MQSPISLGTAPESFNCKQVSSLRSRRTAGLFDAALRPTIQRLSSPLVRLTVYTEVHCHSPRADKGGQLAIWKLKGTYPLDISAY